MECRLLNYYTLLFLTMCWTIYVPPYGEQNYVPVYKKGDSFFNLFTHKKIDKPDFEIIFGIEFDPTLPWISKPVLVGTQYGAFIVEIDEKSRHIPVSVGCRRALSSPITYCNVIDIKRLEKPDISTLRLCIIARLSIYELLGECEIIPGMGVVVCGDISNSPEKISVYEFTKLRRRKEFKELTYHPDHGEGNLILVGITHNDDIKITTGRLLNGRIV